MPSPCPVTSHPQRADLDRSLGPRRCSHTTTPCAQIGYTGPVRARVGLIIVSVAVLGWPAVLGPGGIVPLPGRREPQVLAVLAADVGSVVSFERLADEVWDGRLIGPSTLRVTVNRLRRRLTEVMAEDPIRVEPSGYRLALAPEAVDAHVFGDVVRRAQRARAEGDRVRARTLVEDGERLWRGRAFEGCEHLPSVRPEAERLEELRIVGGQERAVALMEEGDVATALAALEGLIARRPLREELWALRMLGQARTGREAEALATYRELEGVLRRELGIRPNGSVAGLAEAIANRSSLDDLTLAPAGQPPALRRPTAATAGGGAHRLVGRDAELDQLRTAVSTSSQGLRMVVVEGETGVGKTALIEAFAHDHARRSGPALVGRCDRTGAVPLGAVLGALGPLVGPAGGEAGIELAHRSDDLDPGRRAREDLGLQRRRILRLVQQVLARAAEMGPVALVLDDVQWADSLTLALLDHVAHHARDLPLVVVLSRRTGSDPSVVAEALVTDLLRVVPVERLALRGLSSPHIAQLLGPEVAPAAARRIERASGGNPLYILQLQQAHDRGEALDVEPPDDLRQLCRARLAPLSSAVRELLEAVAVLGDDAPASSAAAILGRDRSDVAPHLSEAQRRGLLHSRPALDVQRFVHGVVSQVVEDEIEPGRLAALHLAAADLEAGRPGREGSVAEHVARAWPLAAGDRRLAEASARAGDAALRMGALDEAAAFYRRVVELTSLDPEQVVSARLGLGVGLAIEGDTAGAESAFAQGIAEARAAGRWDLVADGLLGQTRFGLPPSIPEAVVRAAEIDEVLAHRTAIGRETSVGLLCAQADLLMNIEPERVEAALTDAEGIVTSLDDALLALRVDLGRVRQGDAACAPPAICLAEAARALSAATALDAPGAAARAGALLATARLRLGAVAEARADLPSFVVPAERADHPGWAMTLRAIEVGSGMGTLPIDETDAYSLAVTSDPSPGLEGLALGTRVLHLTVIRREQCRMAEVEAMLAASLERSPRQYPRPLLAERRAEEGDPDGAHRHLDLLVEELEQVRPDWIYLATMSLIAEVAASLYRADLVTRAESALVPFEGQVVVGSSGLLVLGRVDRFLGLAASARGDLDLAVDRLSRA